MRGAVPVGALVLLLARAADGRAASALELTSSLATAEVCPGDTEACWPDATSVELHRGEPGAVVLPGRTTTNVYVRVPPQGRLAVEFAARGAALVIGVRTEGQPTTEIYRSPAEGDGGWRSAEIDLAAFGGRLLALGFRTDVLAGDGGGRVLVRRATLAGPPAPAPAVAAPPAAPPNVVVYLIDTVRADHLGCYGYVRPTSPRIDAFARSAIRFTRAIAESSWTLPTTASLLTGLLPAHHGAVGREHAIRTEVPTLAELLRARGYQTVAFVTNYLGADFGQRRGFETFRFYAEDDPRRREVFVRSSALHRRVARWLARHARPPFLLYVHATDPHFPYLPPPRYLRPFRSPRPQAYATVERVRPVYMRWGGERPTRLSPEEVAILADLYDGQLRLADDFFGRLVDALAARGVLDDTLVVLTSDHGEEFADHGGVAHGQTLYQESLRVPLIVRLPGGRRGGSVVDEVVQHTDLLPTVLAAAGTAPPPGLDGRALLVPPVAEPEAYASMQIAGRRLEAVVATSWKVIHNVANPGRPRFEAYDLDVDPGEQRDLAARSPVRLGYARTRLATLAAAEQPGPATSPEQRRRLGALGYVGD